jgi:hypothetical protein
VSRTAEPGDIVDQLLGAAARALGTSFPRSAAHGVRGANGARDDAAFRTVGIGWATVELERAAAELGRLLDLPPDPWTPAGRDQLLGAATLLGPRLGPLVDGPRLVLLEPYTEGRLAASLARHGEGVAAVYVAGLAPTLVPPDGGASPPAPSRSAAAPGPLGRGRLVLGGPIWGPHVIALDATPNPESLPSAGD